MPVHSQRKQAVRIIDAKIAQLARIAYLPGVLDIIVSLEQLLHRISGRRYYNRHPNGPGYQSSSMNTRADRLFDFTEQKHRRAFRMTPSELDGLVVMFGDDEVFVNVIGRKQAPPKVQLGVLVYRLAHGEKLRTIADLFGISGQFKGPLLSPVILTLQRALSSIIASELC